MMMSSSILISKFEFFICFPSQEVRAGSNRKTPEINGNMEAVFQPESLRIFSIGFWLAFRFSARKRS
jgi:hypothetical protein